MAKRYITHGCLTVLPLNVFNLKYIYSLSFDNEFGFLDSRLNRQSQSLYCVGREDSSAGSILVRSLHVSDYFPDSSTTGNYYYKFYFKKSSRFFILFLI